MKLKHMSGWLACLFLMASLVWVPAEEHDPIDQQDEPPAEEEALDPESTENDQEAEEEEREIIPFPKIHPVMERNPEPEEMEMPELWFPVGEEIRYRVYWGRIPVGTSVISTRWVEEYNRTLLSIRIRTRSNSFLDRIYRVDDVIESIIDPHTFLPLRFELNMSQGRHRKHEITKFDYQNGIAYWRSETRDREDNFELEPETRDLLSFAYFMRSVGFEPNEKQHFRVMSDEKIYDLWLEARGTDRIRLRNYGRVRSVELEPEAAFEGLFVRRGRMTLWVSNDDRRLLTQMVGQIPVASIRLVLHEVRGPGNDLWILDHYEDDDEFEG